MNTLYWVMLVLGVLLLLAINGALIALAMRFRGERGREPRRLVLRRPAQFGAAGAVAVLAVIVFVLGVLVTDAAKKVEASGPDGLQAAYMHTAQRGLSAAAGARPAALQNQACGEQGLWH